MTAMEQVARQMSGALRREREGRKKNPIAAALMRSLGSAPPPKDVLFHQSLLLNAPRSIVDDGPPPWRHRRMAELEQQRLERLWAERRRRAAQVAVTAAILLFAACGTLTPAHAQYGGRYKSHHYPHRDNWPSIFTPVQGSFEGPGFACAQFCARGGYSERRNYSPVERSTVVAHPAGCPATLFCGCGVSVRVFGHPVRDLYLVVNWYRFPRASAAPGRVAIFGRYHVAYIERTYGDGTALLYDPNSGGGLTRLHRHSLSGLTIVDPRG